MKTNHARLMVLLGVAVTALLTWAACTRPRPRQHVLVEHTRKSADMTCFEGSLVGVHIEPGFVGIHTKHPHTSTWLPQHKVFKVTRRSGPCPEGARPWVKGVRAANTKLARQEKQIKSLKKALVEAETVGAKAAAREKALKAMKEELGRQKRKLNKIMGRTLRSLVGTLEHPSWQNRPVKRNLQRLAKTVKD